MDNSVERRVAARFQELLVSLPYDLKVLLDVVGDEGLPERLRRMATGAIIYCLLPTEQVPDSSGLLTFADDVVMVRVVLAEVATAGEEAAADYSERYPDSFRGVQDDLQLFEEYFADRMSWLRGRLAEASLQRLRYKGKTVPQYAEEENSSERLYSEAQAFMMDYDVDEDRARRLPPPPVIAEIFDKRRQAEEGRRAH